MRPGDREELESWVRARKTPRRRVERARIVLGSADGLSARALRREVGVSLPTVKRWLDRYEAEGVAGLEDRPRRGRPRTSVTAEVEAEVVRRTLEEDPPSGTHWSTRLMAGAAGLHHGQVARIWRAHGLKPHLARTFKLSTDPKFVEKLRDVVGLYVDPPERGVVFAFDEKSRIQALDRTQPGLPMKKGRCGTMTHDYKRHGTTTLFAALHVAIGEVIHKCLPRHRHQEFLRFMSEVEKRTDPDLDLHVILDNHATHKHKHKKVAAWLGAASARAVPLHAHLGLVAQPRRALLLRADATPAQAARSEQREATDRHDHGLHREPEPGPGAVQVDRRRGGHPGESEPCECHFSDIH